MSTKDTRPSVYETQEDLRANLLQDLQFANSHTRLAAVMELRSVTKQAEWFRILGEEWSGCDNIGLWPRADLVKTFLSGRSHWPAMMTQNEHATWSALSAKVTLYRGCGPMNRLGFSWSPDREIAASFPTLDRFKQTNPLLLTASVPKDRIVAVKLDREESEVICLVQSKHIKREDQL